MVLVKEGPHPTNNRFYLREFRNVFFNHHRLLICYSVLRVAKCWITGAVVSIESRMKINEVRRTVPSFKLLRDSKVYDILIRKSSTIQFFFDCYQLQSLQKNTVSIPSGLFVYKKGKSLSRIDWKFWGYGYTQRLCELRVVCAALFSKSWPYPLRICILLFLSSVFILELK